MNLPRNKNTFNYKRPAFWITIIAAILTLIIIIWLAISPKEEKQDLSFLNPVNILAQVAEKENIPVKLEKGTTYLTPNEVVSWIESINWNKKDTKSPYELSPTYVLKINNEPRQEIRLFDSEPTLAMVLYNDEWSYYDIKKENYEELQFKIMTKNYFEPDTIKPTQNKITQKKELNIDDLTEKAIIKKNNIEDTEYPLIAQLPQDNIYLYGQPDGVVLKYGNNIQTFNWIYTTPRFILPTLTKSDVDNDGEDEIIFVLNVGSGTGVAVYELHVLKLDDTGHYIDYIFDDYLEQVKGLLSFEYNQSEKSVLFKTGKVSYTYAFPPEYANLFFKDISYGNIVLFDVSNGMRINMPLSLVFDDYPTPQFTDIEFEGSILFEDGRFKISDMGIIRP